MSNSSLSELERSEIESLKEDLINSIDLETNSAPTSPLQARFGADLLVQQVKSAPPSPKGNRVNRPLFSVQSLIPHWESKSSNIDVSQVAQTV